MSDSNQDNDSLDLSALSFGPSWARDEKPKKDYTDYAPKEGSKSRKGSFNKGNSRNANRNFSKGGGNNRDRFRKDRDDRGPRFQPIPAPEGFLGDIMPIEEGLDNLATQIKQTARTYSVFDLARMVLQSRDRFNVGLKAPEGTKVFRNIYTFATYLTKDEAVADFWHYDTKSKLYKDITREVEAPTGTFTSVARCTKSGVYLGPPNLHSYQSKLRELHRERFAQLPFEVFQRNIEILKDEDSINAWLESEKTQTFYLPIEDPDFNAKPAQTDKKEEKENTSSKEESPAPENIDAPEEVPETPTEPADNCEAIDEEKLLKTRAELEQHFLANHFEKIYKQVHISWVPSSIPKRLLSPGLFTLLKDTISEEKRYPGKLSSMMCRQLSGRNIAVFKLNKKLKAGPSRPHALPTIDELSERPKELLKWSIANDGKGVEQLWKELLPKDISDEEKAQWYHDFKWLLTQGYVILMEDGQIFFSKKQENTPPPVKKEEKAPEKTEAPEDSKEEEPAKPKKEADTEGSESK